MRQIARKFYRNFLDVSFEIIKGYRISHKSFAKRVTYKNPEIAFELQNKNTPMLLYASHQCNWEWFALSMHVHLSVPAIILYKPLQNPAADAFMKSMRTRFNGKVAASKEAARIILRTKKQHNIFGIAADQSPPRDHVHWARLFGIESDFYPGLVNLPLLMQGAAYYGRTIRTGRGHYEIELVKLADPPFEKGDYTVLKRYIEENERIISEYPEDYLWPHNRWKHTRNENEELIH